MGKSSVDDVYEQVRKTLHASADHDDAAPRTLQPVAPGIRVLALRTPTLPPAAHTNVYVVGPELGPVFVVDPGSPYPDQQAILGEALAGLDVEAVLLTHHHGDHIGGAAAVGAPIWAHAATARLLAGRVWVDRTLVDGETFGDVTCLLTPGHAEGHLCFEIGAATIAGDMVAGLGTILIDPGEGDMAHYLASLERMLDRSACATLLPAHGPAILDGPGKLREYIAHRTMREDRVIAALAARAGGGSLAELVPEVYADTPATLWPLAQRSLAAHLIKLVREHRASEPVPGRWTSTAGPL